MYACYEVTLHFESVGGDTERADNWKRIIISGGATPRRARSNDLAEKPIG